LITQFIEDYLRSGLEVRQFTLEQLVDPVVKTCLQIIQILQDGGCLYVMGNGGSAAMSQHFAAEIIGLNLSSECRKSLAAISLASDISVITSIANDSSYFNIFSCQISTFASTKDLVIGLSTSGTSENVLRGFEMAKICGAKTIALTGCQGLARSVADTVICINSQDTTFIQEEHLSILHVWFKCIERFSDIV
jgi:D-sedoheptulose 7-phosphate isomerase